MRRGPLRGVAGVLLLGLSPIAASAQNLVANGGFSAALADWQESGDGNASPSPDDIDGDPASGSALLSNAGVDAGTRTFPLEQCVVLTGPGVYLIGASASVDPAQVDGRAVVNAVIYEGTDCTGNIRGGAGRLIPRSSSWAMVDVSHPVDIEASMLVRVGVDKPGAGGMLEVQVDDVFVEHTPLLFRSGFE